MIQAGVMDANGEITGQVASTYTDAQGAVQDLESGNYYAILSGDNAEEMVGVVVMTSDEPRAQAVKAQETGGFIVYR